MRWPGLARGGGGSACSWLLALLVLALGTGRIQGDGILVVNSDASVEKYLSAQASFKETIKGATFDLDLGATRAPATPIDRLIASRDPSAIYCIGSKAYLEVHKAARDRTIIVSSALNWQRLPRGRNTIFVANELAAGSQVTLFRYFFPDLARLGVLYCDQYNRQWFSEAQASARDVNMQLVGERVRSNPSPAQLDRAIDNLLSKVDALWLISDPAVLPNLETAARIFRKADAARKPIITYDAAFLDLGPVMVASPDIPTIGRQAAGLLAGPFDPKVREEGFQGPAGSEIVLNLRKATEYGIKLNEDALSSVNRVIR